MFLYISGALFCAVLFVLELCRKDYHVAGFCILAMSLLSVPGIFEYLVRPLAGWCWISYFVYIGASILGTAFRLYTLIPVWDSLLHLSGGFLCTYASLLLFGEMSCRNGATAPSYRSLALGAFCLCLTIAVFWETSEFVADRLIATDNQKDTIVTSINSSLLDPTHSQKTIRIKNITGVQIHTADGKDYSIEGGYLDTGLTDTMRDLCMCMAGEILFILIGRRLIPDSFTDPPEKGV
jgi:hypothetical protein